MVYISTNAFISDYRFIWFGPKLYQVDINSRAIFLTISFVFILDMILKSFIAMILDFYRNSCAFVKANLEVKPNVKVSLFIETD